MFKVALYCSDPILNNDDCHMEFEYDDLISAQEKYDSIKTSEYFIKYITLEGREGMIKKKLNSAFNEARMANEARDDRELEAREFHTQQNMAGYNFDQCSYSDFYPFGYNPFR